MKQSDFLSQIRQYENKPMSREHLKRLVAWAVKKERAECAWDIMQIPEEYLDDRVSLASIIAARGDGEDI